MASLWTPEGEHRVERTGGSDAPQPPGSPGGPPRDDTSGDDTSASGLSAETAASDAELDEEMAEIERELIAAPVGDVIANHCYGLFQLAALYLSQQPPRLDDARLAIDALGAIVGALGDRLGASAEALGEGLAQIRLAYVQLSGAAQPGASPG